MMKKKFERGNPWLFSYLSLAMFCCVVISAVFLYINLENLKNKEHIYTEEKLTLVVEDLEKQLETYKEIGLKITISNYYAPFYFQRNKYYEKLLLDEFTKYLNYSPLVNEYFLYYKGEDILFHSNNATINLNSYLEKLMITDVEKSEILQLLTNPSEMSIYPLNERILIFYPLSISVAKGYNATLCMVLEKDDLSERIQTVSGGLTGDMAVYANEIPLLDTSKQSIDIGKKDAIHIEGKNGYVWIMPQILSKSGVKYFVSNKMSTWNDTNKFPHNSFIWKGIDGSKVYASVPPTHFITWNMPSQIQENWDSYQDKREGGQTLSMYGYGDGGSGATEEMLELQRRFEKVSVMPKTEMMGGSEFLHRNFDGNEKLEEWDGELYLEMHRGCLTTKSDLKRYNRKLEIMLREAELRSVFRMLEGETYPQEQLTENYKLVLLNQFHDILPGSHVHPVYVDAMNDYKKVEESLVDCIGEGEKYFNSLNFDRKHITFVPDTTAGDVIRNGIKGFYCSVEVPALSSISIDKFKLEQNLSDEDNELKHCFKYESLDEGIKLETPYYSTIINSDGSIRSLYDRELDREWVSGSFNKLSLYEDRPGVYDAWDILPSYTDCPCQTYVKESLKFINQTAECIEFSAILGTAASTWKLILRFFKNSRAIEVENDVDWHEKHKLAKMLFDCNVLSREIWCDTSAGFIKRETHKNTTWQQARFEVCHHKWCDISETGGGIALINEGKYGVGVDNQRISLSLLRSTVRPDVEADMGEHKFCYMIVPHAQDAVTAGINRMALEYNVPLAKGNFNNPFNKFDFKNLFLQAVKLSEDGTMVVVRLSEQDGCRGNLKFPQEVKILNMLEDVEKTATELEYKPFEIITIGIDLKSFVK